MFDVYMQRTLRLLKIRPLCRLKTSGANHVMTRRPTSARRRQKDTVYIRRLVAANAIKGKRARLRKWKYA
jgi:hypothetical protein